MSAKLIAFTGYKGHGKTTAAMALMGGYAHRVRFAGPMREMLKALGLTDDELDGTLKEQPCALLSGLTPRHAMQTLGTQWGRDCMDKNFWVNIWKVNAGALLRNGCDVVVDDLRFPNEAFAVRQLGGCIVRIERPDHPIDLSHESEQCVADIKADVVLMNDGSYESLVERVLHFRRGMEDE